jgi:hypothetical protein
MQKHKYRLRFPSFKLSLFVAASLLHNSRIVRSPSFVVFQPNSQYGTDRAVRRSFPLD